MFKVMTPREMNETFARAFNSRSVDNMLALYEAGGCHADPSGKTTTGTVAVRAELEKLLQVAHTMVSNNNFCIESNDLALLRADWTLFDEHGAVLASGSSAEVARRQKDGRWLYVIDHAGGASLPRVT